jgi:hypothetical protein
MAVGGNGSPSRLSLANIRCRLSSRLMRGNVTRRLRKRALWRPASDPACCAGFKAGRRSRAGQWRLRDAGDAALIWLDWAGGRSGELMTLPIAMEGGPVGGTGAFFMAGPPPRPQSFWRTSGEAVATNIHCGPRGDRQRCNVCTTDMHYTATGRRRSTMWSSPFARNVAGAAKATDNRAVASLSRAASMHH